MRAIDRLKRRFPPPTNAIDRGIEDEWPRIQRHIGSVLPRDYKDFINAYGTVALFDFLIPFNPFAGGEYRNLVTQMGIQLSALRELKAKSGISACPYPLWFEPGGLLPWATTSNGDRLYWLTNGHADQWTVVLGKDRSDEFEPFDGSMVEFLLAFLNRSLDPRLEMTDFGTEAPTITPLR